MFGVIVINIVIVVGTVFLCWLLPKEKYRTVIKSCKHCQSSDSLVILQTIKYQNSLTSLLDENAVSFAQAEKLYYETSLISVGNELQSTQNEQGIVLICTHDLMFDNNCTQKATMPGKHYTAMKILNIQELVEFFYQLSNISIHGSLPLLLLRSHWMS